MFSMGVIYWFLFLIMESFVSLVGNQKGLGDRIPRIVLFQSIALALFDLVALSNHQESVVQLYASSLISVVVFGFYKQWRMLEAKIERRWHTLIVAGIYAVALIVLQQEEVVLRQAR